MAGPIIEAAKKRLGIEDEDTVRERIDDSPLLEEHRERLEKEMGDTSGCCSAAMAAEATRNRGTEYR